MRNKQNEIGTYLVGDFYYVTPLWQRVNKVHISNITELTGVHLIKNLKNEVFQIPEAVLQGFFRPHCLASFRKLRVIADGIFNLIQSCLETLERRDYLRSKLSSE